MRSGCRTTPLWRWLLASCLCLAGGTGVDAAACADPECEADVDSALGLVQKLARFRVSGPKAAAEPDLEVRLREVLSKTAAESSLGWQRQGAAVAADGSLGVGAGRPLPPWPSVRDASAGSWPPPDAASPMLPQQDAAVQSARAEAPPVPVSRQPLGDEESLDDLIRSVSAAERQAAGATGTPPQQPVAGALPAAAALTESVEVAPNTGLVLGDTPSAVEAQEAAAAWAAAQATGAAAEAEAKALAEMRRAKEAADRMERAWSAVQATSERGAREAAANAFAAHRLRESLAHKLKNESDSGNATESGGGKSGPCGGHGGEGKGRCKGVLRVITFNNKTKVLQGLMDWAAIVLGWLVSLYVCGCLIRVTPGVLCCCQFSCLLIIVMVCWTIMHGGSPVP